MSKAASKKGHSGASARGALNRDRVLRAAVALADELGIGALSMRALGQRLGVEAMSLYKHVTNKDDVLDGIVDRVAAEIELPSHEGPWRVEMRRRAISAHRVLLKHPWATMLIVSRANVGPAMLRYVDTTIGCLVNAGFSYALADHAWNALDSYTYGFTLQKLNFPFAPDEYAEVAKAYLPQIPKEEFPHLYGMSLQIIEGQHDGLHDIDLGLELLLDGLERLRVAGR